MTSQGKASDGVRPDRSLSCPWVVVGFVVTVDGRRRGGMLRTGADVERRGGWKAPVFELLHGTYHVGVAGGQTVQTGGKLGNRHSAACKVQPAGTVLAVLVVSQLSNSPRPRDDFILRIVAGHSVRSTSITGPALAS